ncbi:MAG: NADH-quinone oxidoreductase subunit NuoE [Oscillospiraceae bacterium]|jgi:NADP-reducing hydrogenase subunit HndA|nr:NADH-quinone oxidoreductase subunit NuoE [Oscillospiraceae bacterium]
MKTIQTVPFTGTKEQEQQLLAWLDDHADEDGIALQSLQMTQQIYGYIPKEAMITIATVTGIPLSELYGITTFYSQFRLFPIGEYKISVCLGTACYVKGTQAVLDKLISTLGVEEGETTPDGKFSLETCRCIGACGLAPVITINDDVYGRLTANEVERILANY